jgi:hypothetical protein
LGFGSRREEGGLLQVSAVTINDLDEAKLRLLRLALNRLREESSWRFDALTLDFPGILEIEIDVGFARSARDEEDELPPLDETATPITKLGDLWLVGEHRVVCGAFNSEADHVDDNVRLERPDFAAEASGLLHGARAQTRTVRSDSQAPWGL